MQFKKTGTKPNLGNVSKAYPNVITVSEAKPIFGNLTAANPNVNIASKEKLDVVNVSKAKQHVCNYCSKVYKSYTGIYNHVQSKLLQKNTLVGFLLNSLAKNFIYSGTSIMCVTHNV